MAAQAKPGVQERILLHLLDYSDYKDSIEVPFALSQMGIANAVAIARSNVPRAIAGLKDQGILVERQAHVKGVSRKRKAYFLTDTGISLANETWERLSEFPVRCILDDQPAVETTLNGAKSVLPFEMRPVDIIRYIDEHNCLDVRNLSADLVERDLSKHVEKQLRRHLLTCHGFGISTGEPLNLTTWSISLKPEQPRCWCRELQVLEKRPWRPN